jgi:hypothetical protein
MVSGLTKTGKFLQPLGVERLRVFGQNKRNIYSCRKGIGIPDLFEWNTYSSSKGNSYYHGISIPINNVQPNKEIVIPWE